ncbi:hypothetical protein [Bdellovibrio bacteriovorus]|uniref:hypothetical protein n=1 Tax=Bdellovibrio bacteriovorus TaxID=959 RepID=UPI0035A66A8D
MMEALDAESEIRRRTYWLTVTLAVVSVYFVCLLFWFTEGFTFFKFTLDDPYIHMKLAKNIGLGHYGFNLSQYSAPSSSILWPFFLAPFSTSSYFEFAPLIINIILSFVLIVLIFKTILDFQFSARNTSFLTLVIIAFVNLFGMTVNGLEHVLQMIAVVLIFREFSSILKDEKRSICGISLVLAFSICIRYEMLIFWAAIACFYLYKRQFKKTFFVSILPLLPAIAFSLYLKSLGLGYLPSSVVAKTAGDSNFFVNLCVTFYQNATSRQGLGLLVLTGVNVYLFRRTSKVCYANLLVILVPIALHLMVGKFGWFYRYEIYILLYTILIFLSLSSQIVFNKCAFFFSAVFLFWLCEPYIWSVQKLNQAARNIHYQQGITSQFAQKYLSGPIAVNDIGLVGLRYNDEVLDLWGLASQEALQARLNSSDFRWVSKLANARGVDVLLIYESWIQPPSQWKKVGEFVLLENNVVLGGDKVSVFSTEEKVESLREALRKFNSTIGSAPIQINILN